MQFVFAQDVLPIERKPLLSANLDSSKKVNRVEIKQIVFKPNQATGLHLHPCPVVGYITKGIVLLQIEGQKPKALVEGDAFFEPANIKIIHFDNASVTQPLIFVAFYLLGKDNTEIIRML